jgi:hypothetical protein
MEPRKPLDTILMIVACFGGCFAFGYATLCIPSILTCIFIALIYFACVAMTSFVVGIWVTKKISVYAKLGATLALLAVLYFAADLVIFLFRC